MFPPGHILRNRTQVLLNINTAMAAANIYVPVYYIPLYFSFTRGDSELMAAVRLLPYICFLATLERSILYLTRKSSLGEIYWTVARSSRFIAGEFCLHDGVSILEVYTHLNRSMWCPTKSPYHLENGLTLYNRLEKQIRSTAGCSCSIFSSVPGIFGNKTNRRT